MKEEAIYIKNKINRFCKTKIFYIYDIKKIQFLYNKQQNRN